MKIKPVKFYRSYTASVLFSIASMARAVLISLLLLACLALVRAQSTFPLDKQSKRFWSCFKKKKDSTASICFLQQTCTECVGTPNCGWCSTPRRCTDVASLNAFCVAEYPDAVALAQGTPGAVELCAGFPDEAKKKCLDTDVNLTNGQLAGISTLFIFLTFILNKPFFLFPLIRSCGRYPCDRDHCSWLHCDRLLYLQGSVILNRVFESC